MKSLKILLGVFLVTFLMSAAGIKAADTNSYVFQLSVPPFNGYASPLDRVKQYHGNDRTQKVKEVKIEPAKDTLDVKLRVLENNGHYGDASSWHILADGQITDFNLENDKRSFFDSIVVGRLFELYIDSRINYTKPTPVTGRWYVN